MRARAKQGLVAFAGRPRDASPVTLDHKWLRRALGELRLNDQFDRGTISGVVKDQSGAIVPGVTVTFNGAPMTGLLPPSPAPQSMTAQVESPRLAAADSTAFS